MKVQSLDQNLKCPNCRALQSVKNCRRITNFTFGEVTLFCRNCRTKFGLLNFEKWNALHRAAYKKSEEKKVFNGTSKPQENQRNFRR